MYICEYCGSHFKDKNDNCPSCGGNKFRKIQNIGETIIKQPPKGGYKLNFENYEYEKKLKYTPKIFVAFILFVIIIWFFFIFAQEAFDGGENESYGASIMIILLLVIFVIKVWNGVKGELDKIKIQNEKIRRLKYLANHGWLIKNLKYTIKPADKSVNLNGMTYIIQVVYEIEKGKTKYFKSEPKYLTALGRDNGTVDLLIDPNDHTNYFIDFEIS